MPRPFCFSARRHSVALSGAFLPPRCIPQSLTVLICCAGTSSRAFAAQGYATPPLTQPTVHSPSPGADVRPSPDAVYLGDADDGRPQPPLSQTEAWHLYQRTQVGRCRSGQRRASNSEQANDPKRSEWVCVASALHTALHRVCSTGAVTYPVTYPLARGRLYCTNFEKKWKNFTFFHIYKNT